MTLDTAHLRQEADAMKAAVSGIPVGETLHAVNWADKPHRVLYDALNLLLQACEEIDRLNAAVANAPKQTEPIQVSMLTEREAIDVAKTIVKDAENGWDFISQDECDNFEPNVETLVRVISENLRRLVVSPEEFTKLRPVVIGEPTIAALPAAIRLAIVEGWKKGGMHGYEYLECGPNIRAAEPAIAAVLQKAVTTAAPAEGGAWSVGPYELHAGCGGYPILYKGGPEYLLVPHTWHEERPEIVQDVLNLLNRGD
jgi:hypothetical protein